MYCRPDTPEKHTVYLALGSNIENRRQHLTTALTGLRRVVEIQAVSSIYETEPVGYLEQPPFLNLVCAGQTELSPRELLLYVKSLEREGGREPTFRNGPRSIDIDILLYDQLSVAQEDLVIPHPRMSTRAFVLVPLAEIAPDAVIPGRGKAVRELLKNISSLHGVQKITSEQ